MEQTIYSNEKIKNLIEQLKRHEIEFYDIPEDLRTDNSIVDIERKLGLRKSCKRGYDVINNFFFVEEIMTSFSTSTKQTIRTTFPDFTSYYLFLDGNIYENSCYYQLDFSTIQEEIDTKRLSKKAFEITTIDDYVLNPSEDEMQIYYQADHTKMICQKWIKKFNACHTYAELAKNVKNYNKSKIANIVDVSFFFFQYIFTNVHDKNRFNVIMEYMSYGEYPTSRILYGLCSIYNPDNVIAAYEYFSKLKQTKPKYKKKLRNYVNSLNDNGMSFSKCCYFDSKTHYFCEEWSNGFTNIFRYFETFDAFITYRQGDLTDCDISNVIGLDLNLSNYIIDSTTKLPFNLSVEITYVVEKTYKNGEFIVQQTWYDLNKNIIKHYNHTFCYFFDFVTFLKADLSNANLLFCDGLKNLTDPTGLNLSGARLTSEISQKLGVEYDNFDVDTRLIQSFIPTIMNEKETALALQTNSTQELYYEERIKKQKVYYISDLHLMHRINHANCKSENDIVYVISNVVKKIIQGVYSQELESRPLLLIGGDTSSEFSIFTWFIKILKNALDEKLCDIDVIFVLGNHELWGFPEQKLSNIINKYNSLIQSHGMYLLQNDILYKKADGHVGKITSEELLSFDKATIRKYLDTSRIIILGGLAFSGYNEEFNAKNGIYMLTLDRKTEIKETQKFEKIYNIVCETLSDKNLIILTHTPKCDWSKSPKLQKHFFMLVVIHTIILFMMMVNSIYMQIIKLVIIMKILI